MSPRSAHGTAAVHKAQSPTHFARGEPAALMTFAAHGSFDTISAHLASFGTFPASMPIHFPAVHMGSQMSATVFSTSRSMPWPTHAKSMDFSWIHSPKRLIFSPYPFPHQSSSSPMSTTHPATLGMAHAIVPTAQRSDFPDCTTDSPAAVQILDRIHGSHDGASHAGTHSAVGAVHAAGFWNSAGFSAHSSFSHSMT